VTVLLDTSALLVHFFKEPHGERVQGILADESNRILIPSVCITEIARRLVALGHANDEARAIALSYASLAEEVIAIDLAVAVRAFELSTLTPNRVPLVDAVIAACASVAEATLIHRDAHFRALPQNLVQIQEV
jgi:predicted nucleic acid-binding protein